MQEDALNYTPAIQVVLFGEVVFQNAENAVLDVSNRRGRILLAMLCLSPDQPLQREFLSKLIWEGRFRPQARASLRQCLHDLNRELQGFGLDVLDTSNTQIVLRPGVVRTDLQQLEMALAQGNAELATRSLNQIAGQRLLENIDHGEALEVWLEAQRLQVENRLRRGVEHLLSDLKTRNETGALNALRMAWQQWSHPVRPRSLTTLAILPFTLRNELGGDYFLAEGAADELSAQLAMQTDISLAGRTSIEAVCRQGLTAPEIAGRLGVSHLVEGNVYRSAQGVSLTISLLDGTSGRQVWTDRVEATEAEFFNDRGVIGRNVLAGLCEALGIAERITGVPRRMTANRDAYALYLQGRSLTQKAMIDGALAKAVDLLEQALQLDPDFAEAWTALAEAYISTIVYTPCLNRVERSEKAAGFARRALELNPGQGYAYAILSIHEWTCFNPARALEYAMQAYRLEPNNADVTMRLGSCMLYLGRTRDALPYIEDAIDQDPVYARNYAMLCIAQLNLGDFDKALKAGQRMVDLNMPGLHLALVQAAMGEHEAAVATYYDARRFVGTMIMSPPGAAEISNEARDFYLLTAAKGICSGDADARQTYCNLIDMLHQTLPEPYDPSVAWPAVFMGHAELAMKIFRERIHPANMPALMNLWADVDPLNRIRLHPDFMSFAEDIGLVEAWENYGWPDLMPSDPR
ncbi:MAG: tetratricopeptide repeat protein [Alphaproteobacteria bacterium]|nr:tetratricopeptide repeat protein [Alphaproteobacteria bacterium]